MKCYTWDGLGGYDHFIGVDEAEMRAIVSYYATEKAEGKKLGGDFFYLLCDEKRVITPLPFLALAFGGQYNEYRPYGKETTCHFSMSTMNEYRLELDWEAPK